METYIKLQDIFQEIEEYSLNNNNQIIERNEIGSIEDVERSFNPFSAQFAKIKAIYTFRMHNKLKN